MAVVVSRSAPADRSAILTLLAEARGDDLKPEERARRGFVQGRMDETMLAECEAATGVFVARDNSKIIGVAATSLPHLASRGPAAALLAAVDQVLSAAEKQRLFLYGPVAVDRRYQGQGILTRLLIGVCTELHDFAVGAAFVELVNRKSMAIHRHFPMQQATGFTVDGRSYAAFTFSPARVLAHYSRAS